MDAKAKIYKLSRFLKTISFAIMGALPLFCAAWWITNGYSFLGDIPDCLRPYAEIKGIRPVSEMSSLTKLCGFLVTMIPTTFSVLAFFFLAKLFTLYSRFEFFSQNNVRCIRNLGITILTQQLVYPLYFGLLTLSLTFSNPPGERFLTIALESDQIYLMIVAGGIILVSWIMDEGRKLQEEQAAVI